MAKPTDRFSDNAAGRWFVDRQCILCSICAELAPKNFKESEAKDHDIVYKQPENAEEEKQCQSALEQCPVEAIGKDNV